MVCANKNTLRTLGILFIIFGVLLILIVLLGSMQIYNCPPYGMCPPYNFSYVAMSWSGLILGIALLIIGIILLLTARKMEPEPDADK